MTNWKKIGLFVILVTMGLFLIETLLVGLPGPKCDCFDGSALQEECEAVCTYSGGCLYISIWFPGYCAEEYLCCTLITNYCENGKIRGFSCVGCFFDCEPL